MKDDKKPRKNKHFKRPSLLFYHLFCAFLWPIYRLRAPYRMERDALKGIKGPAVVLAPHTSFSDFAYVALALYPHRVTFVMNRVYFANPLLRFLFRFLRPIPKKLFLPDLSTVRAIYAAKENKAIIGIFPEGRLTTDGISFPLAAGTAELIKKLGVDVYVLSCNGAYLVRPKWSDKKRKGRITVSTKKLFCGADLADMDIADVKSALSGALAHNDEDFAAKSCLYKCTEMAKGLEKILYLCPKCKQEFTLSTEKDKISCSCGFSATLDESYFLHGAPYARISEWNAAQKRELSEELDTLTFSVPVRAVAFENNRRVEKGGGVCYMDAQSFRFESERLSFSYPTASLIGLPYTAGSDIGVYHREVLYYFYLKENPNQCAKWSLFVGLCVERAKENARQVNKPT